MVKAETTRKHHSLRDQVIQVEATHPGLGRTAVAVTVAALAGRFVFCIAPAGCGKSTISNAVGQVQPNIRFDSVTRAGLARRAEELSGYRGALLIDDVGRVETEYILQNMLVTLVELAYGHSINKDSGLFNFEITEFRGGVVANVQPTILRKLVKMDQWESNLSDKSLRFYHLARPVTPSMMPISLDVALDVPPDEVTFQEQDGADWRELLSIGLKQWGRTRVKEHLGTMLRVMASLDGRSAVENIDLKALAWLLKPMSLERTILQRGGFEADRTVNLELLHLLSAFVTYGAVTVDTIVSDYKLGISTVYEIFERQSKWARIVRKNPTTWKPSDLAVQVMKECGYSVPK